MNIIRAVVVAGVVAVLMLSGCAASGAAQLPPSPTAVNAPPTPAPATAMAATAEPAAVPLWPIAADRLALQRERAAHTATLLPDGSVLLAGGFAGSETALADAELFDRQLQAFRPTAAMGVARQSHTATLLPDGRVLIAGGFNGEYLDSAELYDPATGKFTPAGSLVTARSGHVAVLLNSGQVLLAGGTGEGWSFLADAELYDPVTNTFRPTGRMGEARESHTATLLHNGRVLITGGHRGRRSDVVIYDSAEVYEPERGEFSTVGSMTVRRHKHDATLLADGRVFISGGADERDAGGTYRSTELFDPASGTFAPAGAMNSARYKHTGTSLLLPDGRVLLIGGAPTSELFEPRTGTFTTVNGLEGETRLFATATLLRDGMLLFAGGYGQGVATSGSARIIRFGSG